MKNLKDVKIGDVLELNKKDVIFIDACLKSSRRLERGGTKLIEQSQEAAKTGWKSIYIKWPEFVGYNLSIDPETKTLVILSDVK